MSTRSPPSVESLFRQIDDARLVDIEKFRRRLHKIRRLSGPSGDRALERLARQIQESRDWVGQRRNTMPQVRFPPELPISQRAEEIGEAIDSSPVVVICGETGSGKSTQLPKICLERGLGTRGTIGHTQPRRIAARAIAARLAEELGETPGRTVGFKIRFSDQTGPDCRVKVMTDGILLAETQHDRWLEQYDALIIDEAHERSLNIDFLLGYVKKIRSRRPDLRLVITSATIDPERFSRHFGDAPVIEVSGRTFPVEDRYRPLAEGDETLSQTDGILAAVDELAADGDGSGDILVFLAGERDIRETAEALRKHHPEGVQVLPLFARLSAAEQDRIFRPVEQRRIVLATNIAETSLTVPRIRYVVDPGFARISRYSYRTKIQRLLVEPISRASADQRRGRCGRQRDGICIRLYGEDDYLARPEYTDPEIRRTNLASVILRMACSRLGRIEDFPFIDPPDNRYIRDGYRLLRELSAVDGDGAVTPLGRRIARYPLDPRLGRILMAATDEGCLREILPIVSFLSIQDPRERPLEARQPADERHRQWRIEGSDLLGIVSLWHQYLECRRHLSVNKQRRWTRDNFLSFMRMREWYSVHQQLVGQIKDSGHRVNREPADEGAVHRAFLTGMLGHIGLLDEGEYSGPRGSRFLIARDSSLRGSGARWVVAASLVQTERVFAHTVARVQPDWIEKAAAHLVKRRYEAPRWQERRGHVTARERVSLYGLVLAAGRRVDYERVSPAEARDIFLEEALAGDRLGVDAPFVRHNRQLMNQVRDLEARLRRRDLLRDRAAFKSFFETRVPEEIRNRPAFQRWRKKAERENPELLFMSLDDVLVRSGSPAYDPSDYPDVLNVEGNDLRLEYRFEPGAENDGITLVAPQSLLPMLDSRRLDWLIPGYLEEKITAMIRALPKSLRRHLVPAPDVARRCLARIDGGGDFRAALARELTREAGMPVAPDAWAAADLPHHLEFNIQVTDQDGRPLAESRNLADLQRRLGPAGPVEIQASGREYRGMTDWEVGELPRTMAITGPGGERRLFPALHDDGDSASLAYYASREQAMNAHREGTLRLIRIACRQAERYLKKEYRKAPLAPLLVGLGMDGGDPIEDLVWLAFVETFLPVGSEPVLGPAEFEARVGEGRGRVVAVGNELATLVQDILEGWRACRARVTQELGGTGTAGDADDLAFQLESLVFPGWLRVTPVRWMREIPRYLAAVGTRLDKIRLGDGRARARSAPLEPHVARLRAWTERGQPIWAPEIADYRWMVEEFRVSVYAQPLGTAVKVSPERLERQWDRLARTIGKTPA